MSRGSGLALRGLVAQAAAVQRRAIQDALSDGMAVTYERRAAALEWARPVASDFPGRATADHLAERDRRLAAMAAACRHRATLGLSSDDLGLLDVVLDEVAG